jgi:hypothetical protein
VKATLKYIDSKVALCLVLRLRHLFGGLSFVQMQSYPFLDLFVNVFLKKFVLETQEGKATLASYGSSVAFLAFDEKKQPLYNPPSFRYDGNGLRVTAPYGSSQKTTERKISWHKIQSLHLKQHRE